MTISAQEILDDHTAQLSVNPSVANSLATLTDTMNNEAITLKCWDTPQFAAMGEVPDISDNDDVSGKNEANNPVDSGYFDQSTIGGFSGGGLI
jgi:hypothetical protein